MNSTTLDGHTLFAYPDALEREVREVLGGRYAARVFQVSHPVRRVLDVGARAGEFGAWAFKRWPGCWVDWIEDSEELAAIAAENAPPGAQRLVGGSLCADHYDVVRVTSPEWLALLPSLRNVPIVIVDVVRLGKETK